MHLRGGRLFRLIGMPGLPFIFPFPFGLISGRMLNVVEGPTFVCNLIDGKAEAAGIRGADLGIGVADGSKLLLLFGDTKGVTTSEGGASSVLESAIPFDFTTAKWSLDKGKLVQPLTSARKEGADLSTVPTGAIVVKGALYIFAMQVEHWGFNSPQPTRSHGVLYKRTAGLTKEVARWPADSLHVNTSPISGTLPDGTNAVFMLVSGKYRKSPIYMSYALPGEIENPSSYHYLTKYDQNGLPVWSTDISEAVPMMGFEDVWAGEMSLAYNPALKKYFLMFKNYSDNLFEIDTSDTPYGPFSGFVRFQPCGTPPNRPHWMKPEWGGCYGGFIIPDSFGPDGHDLNFTISLWKPYITVVLRMRIKPSEG